jgi:hypothetical protein
MKRRSSRRTWWGSPYSENIKGRHNYCHYVILWSAGFAITLNYHPAGSPPARWAMHQNITGLPTTTIIMLCVRCCKQLLDNLTPGIKMLASKLPAHQPGGVSRELLLTASFFFPLCASRDRKQLIANYYTLQQLQCNYCYYPSVATECFISSSLRGLEGLSTHWWCKEELHYNTQIRSAEHQVLASSTDHRVVNQLIDQQLMKYKVN